MMGKTKMQLVLVILMVSFGLSLSEVYRIDESSGWINGQIQCMPWPATANFRVGDTIVFEYNKVIHHVVLVTQHSIKACNATPPSTWATGKDTFHIRKVGNSYFICIMPGHRQVGQKVDIRISKTPSPSLTPYNTIPPAPSPLTHGTTPHNPMSQSPNPPTEGPAPHLPISPPTNPTTHGPTPHNLISPPPRPPTHDPAQHSPISPTPTPSEEVLPSTPAPRPSSCSSVYTSLTIWKLVFSFGLGFIIAL